MFYEMKIAGYPVQYSFNYKKTAGYFGDEIYECMNPLKDPVSIPETLLKRYSLKNCYGNAYSEYMCTPYATSTALLKNDCCCFHSVAIRVYGKGYLISAASGVGKTTQYHNLKKLYGDVIEIINGDKPFLHFLSDGRIMIHTSPWRGKENYGSGISSELAGIIFLKQADENVITRVIPENYVVTSLSKFLYLADSEETVRKVCNMDERLITSTPLYMLRNKGDLLSSELLYKTVLSGETGL